ncbi:unnamed protein product, partial [Prorocentrum cordatum]
MLSCLPGGPRCAASCLDGPACARRRPRPGSSDVPAEIPAQARDGAGAASPMGPPAAAAPPCGGPTSPAAASSRRQNSDATPHSNEETSWPGPQQQSTLSTSAQDFVEQGMAVPGRKRYRNGTALAATITGALGGLAAGGPVGLLVGGAIGALAGGVHAYARTKEPPSRRRLKFLILWARLQLQECAPRRHESVSAAASLRNQRDIVDYVVVEHAPWALRLIEGLGGGEKDFPAVHGGAALSTSRKIALPHATSLPFAPDSCSRRRFLHSRG